MSDEEVTAVSLADIMSGPSISFSMERMKPLPHTPEQDARWEEWKAVRPADMRAVCDRFDPWSVYEMKSTGQLCQIVSFFESDATSPVSLGVYAEHRDLGAVTGVTVVGVDPDDLVPFTGGPDGEFEGGESIKPIRWERVK
jgi:hypothetical protein